MEEAMTNPYDEPPPAMVSARANIERARRLRGLAKEATTVSLRERLLAEAKECERYAGREERPRVDQAVLRVARERTWIEDGRTVGDNGRG
jgi:hypothetical protein